MHTTEKMVEDAASDSLTWGASQTKLIETGANETANMTQPVFQAANKSAEMMMQTIHPIWQAAAVWFIIGAVIAVSLFLLFSYILRKK